MSAFKPKGMWEATRRLELEAYDAGRRARCAELVALRQLEQAVRDCGLPGLMCSGDKFRAQLVEVLAVIDKARGG